MAAVIHLTVQSNKRATKILWSCHLGILLGIEGRYKRCKRRMRGSHTIYIVRSPKFNAVWAGLA